MLNVLPTGDSACVTTPRNSMVWRTRDIRSTDKSAAIAHIAGWCNCNCPFFQNIILKQIFSKPIIRISALSCSWQFWRHFTIRISDPGSLFELGWRSPGPKFKSPRAAKIARAALCPNLNPNLLTQYALACRQELPVCMTVAIVSSVLSQTWKPPAGWIA